MSLQPAYHGYGHCELLSHDHPDRLADVWRGRMSSREALAADFGYADLSEAAKLSAQSAALARAGVAERIEEERVLVLALRSDHTQKLRRMRAEGRGPMWVTASTGRTGSATRCPSFTYVDHYTYAGSGFVVRAEGSCLVRDRFTRDSTRVDVRDALAMNQRAYFILRDAGATTVRGGGVEVQLPRGVAEYRRGWLRVTQEPRGNGLPALGGPSGRTVVPRDSLRLVDPSGPLPELDLRVDMSGTFLDRGSRPPIQAWREVSLLAPDESSLDTLWMLPGEQYNVRLFCRSVGGHALDGVVLQHESGHEFARVGPLRAGRAARLSAALTAEGDEWLGSYVRAVPAEGAISGGMGLVKVTLFGYRGEGPM